MEVLETLAVALGFATLAGLNLYLVVLVTGLAIQQGWVDVSATYPDLVVLGDPAVVTAAGVFFCLEFFSDKIPWVDSLWDTVHTLVRPVGGGLLALQTLGPTEPGFEVIIAMLAGGTTLISHGFKSGTRLAINASPEPISNVGASVTEDVAVLGGLALLGSHPLVAGAVCIAFLFTALYFTPKLFRRSRAFFWLLTRKIASPFSRSDDSPSKVLVSKSKGLKGFTPMTFGRLYPRSEKPRSMRFVARKMGRNQEQSLDLSDFEISLQSRFFSEDIRIEDIAGARTLLLRFPSGKRAAALRTVEELITSRDEGIGIPSHRNLLAGTPNEEPASAAA